MAVSLKLPLVLVDDADLVRVSEENPGYQFEREDDGTLTVSPTFTSGGARSGAAFFQLYPGCVDPRLRNALRSYTAQPDAK
jgi:hypothetical protein